MQSIHQKEQIYTFCYVLVMPYILYMSSVYSPFSDGVGLLRAYQTHTKGQDAQQLQALARRHSMQNHSKK